jgi:hypothetical protein
VAEFGEGRVVGFELFAGVDMVVIVVHGPVGIVPALDAFGEVFGAVFTGVALFFAAEDDEDLVLGGDFDVGVGGFAVDEDVAVVEAVAEEFG